jgi:carbon-monoxide dehydrogenase large subunit
VVHSRSARAVRADPHRHSHRGAVYDSGDYVARLDEALRVADASGVSARRAEAERRGKLRGLGVGPYIEGTGGVPWEFAEVKVHGSGTVEVPLGALSQGQGHETVFAQVIAERLGVPYDAVQIVMGDTDRLAKGWGTFASRTMVRTGGASAEVVDLVISLGRNMAAHLLEASASDIEYRSGAYRVIGTDRSIDLFDVARAAETGTLPRELGKRLAASKMHENPHSRLRTAAKCARSRSTRRPV